MQQPVNATLRKKALEDALDGIFAQRVGDNKKNNKASLGFQFQENGKKKRSLSDVLDKIPTSQHGQKSGRIDKEQYLAMAEAQENNKKIPIGLVAPTTKASAAAFRGRAVLEEEILLPARALMARYVRQRRRSTPVRASEGAGTGVSHKAANTSSQDPLAVLRSYARRQEGKTLLEETLGRALQRGEDGKSDILASYYDFLDQPEEAIRCCNQALEDWGVREEEENPKDSRVAECLQLRERMIRTVQAAEARTKLLTSLNSAAVHHQQQPSPVPIPREKVSELSCHDFYERYAKRREPVIIVDGVDRCVLKGTPRWTFDLVRQEAGGKVATLRRLRPGSTEWAQLGPGPDARLSDFLDAIEASEANHSASESVGANKSANTPAQCGMAKAEGSAENEPPRESAQGRSSAATVAEAAAPGVRQAGGGASPDLGNCYLFDWSLPLNCPALARRLHIPRYFAGDLLQQLPPGAALRDSWPSLFAAPRGARGALHVDAAGTGFWMAQLAGRKRWRLWPAALAPALYPRWDGDGLDPTFAVDPLAPPPPPAAPPGEGGHPAYHGPGGAAGRGWAGDLRAGELLYVPAGCPHLVENPYGPTLAVSANFVGPWGRARAAEELRRAGWRDPAARAAGRALAALGRPAGGEGETGGGAAAAAAAGAAGAAGGGGCGGEGRDVPFAEFKRGGWEGADEGRLQP